MHRPQPRFCLVDLDIHTSQPTGDTGVDSDPQGFAAALAKVRLAGHQMILPDLG